MEHQGHATLVTNSFDVFILVQSTETPILILTLIFLSWLREIKVLIVNHILQCFVPCRNGNGGNVDIYLQWSRNGGEFVNASAGANH